MKFLAFVLLLTCSVTTFADGIKPLTKEEALKLERFTTSPQLVECMALYQFDFFSTQLGFSIDGSEKSQSELLVQLRSYLNTGKLTPQDPKVKIAKDMAKHCEIVAQTAVEMLALMMIGKPVAESTEN